MRGAGREKGEGEKDSLGGSVKGGREEGREEGELGLPQRKW